MNAPRYEWQPTTAEIALMAGIEPGEVIRFDHNTTPAPTPWAADIASEAAMSLNEYPAASYRTLREAAAQLTGLDPERIVPGAGVDELLLLCGRAFLVPGSRTVQVTPTYPLYRIAAMQAGADVTSVPSTPPAFAFPTDALVTAVRDADLVWLCVPNNPTGTTTTPEAIDSVIAASDGLVVIDAAYAEFDLVDWTTAVLDNHNVIVLRTLSKAFGLAGARVGYAMAHPSLIDRLDAVRPPGSISSISVALGVAALESPQRMLETVGAITEARADLASKLRGLGWAVLDSHTNFLLSRVGVDADVVAKALMERGLVVRTFSYEPLTEHIRLTVRTPHQHNRLLEELERIRQ